MSEWVSSEDRKPFTDGSYLVCTNVNSIEIAEYCMFLRRFQLSNDLDGFEHVTHWMPLPEPPTE
ncbi:DUF551 domain-containing protein [Salmonella enterica]|nr:DUF551 domain-containing protein [Salmonella enterica]